MPTGCTPSSSKSSLLSRGSISFVQVGDRSRDEDEQLRPVLRQLAMVTGSFGPRKTALGDLVAGLQRRAPAAPPLVELRLRTATVFSRELFADVGTKRGRGHRAGTPLVGGRPSREPAVVRRPDDVPRAPGPAKRRRPSGLSMSKPHLAPAGQLHRYGEPMRSRFERAGEVRRVEIIRRIAASASVRRCASASAPPELPSLDPVGAIRTSVRTMRPVSVFLSNRPPET